jgi:hypothetical protein
LQLSTLPVSTMLGTRSGLFMQVQNRWHRYFPFGNSSPLVERKREGCMSIRKGWPFLRSLRVLAALSFVLSVAFLQGSCLAWGGRIAVRVGKTVEVTSSYNYCWFPTIHQFPTGEIMATMRMSPDDENPEGEFAAYSISKDGGHTWSPRYTLGAGGNVDDAYTQVAGGDGAIWALGAGYLSLEPYPPGQAKQFRTALTKFSDGGMVIDQIRDALIRLPEPVQGRPPRLQGRQTKDASKLNEVFDADPGGGAIIGGPKGEWISTLFYMSSKDSGFWRLIAIRSNDNGHTWDELGTISSPGRRVQPSSKMSIAEGPTEAGLVRLGGNNLYSIFRMEGPGGVSGVLDMGESWSSDDGKTWSKTVDTGFKGVAPHLRLLSDGVLACTYGRPGPVTIMFSLDGGHKWTNVTPLYSGMSTRYTDLVEVRPGEVLVIYDAIPNGGAPIPPTDNISKNSIYTTFVEVRKK